MSIAVEDADGVTVRPIESPFGAFTVCSDANEVAIARVLDAPHCNRPERSLLTRW